MWKDNKIYVFSVYNKENIIILESVLSTLQINNKDVGTSPIPAPIVKSLEIPDLPNKESWSLDQSKNEISLKYCHGTPSYLCGIKETFHLKGINYTLNKNYKSSKEMINDPILNSFIKELTERGWGVGYYDGKIELFLGEGLGDYTNGFLAVKDDAVRGLEISKHLTVASNPDGWLENATCPCHASYEIFITEKTPLSSFTE